MGAECLTRVSHRLTVLPRCYPSRLHRPRRLRPSRPRLGLGGVKAAKLGFAIAADHWGHGYATDAARNLITFGFAKLGLHRRTAAKLVPATNPGNPLTCDFTIGSVIIPGGIATADVFGDSCGESVIIPGGIATTRTRRPASVGGIPIWSQLGDFRHRCLATTSHRAAGATAAMTDRQSRLKLTVRDSVRDGRQQPGLGCTT